MKRGTEFTGTALLGGFYVHLDMIEYLQATEMSPKEMKTLEKAAM